MSTTASKLLPDTQPDGSPEEGPLTRSEYRRLIHYLHEQAQAAFEAATADDNPEDFLAAIESGSEPAAWMARLILAKEHAPDPDRTSANRTAGKEAAQ